MVKIPIKVKVEDKGDDGKSIRADEDASEFWVTHWEERDLWVNPDQVVAVEYNDANHSRLIVALVEGCSCRSSVSYIAVGTQGLVAARLNGEEL